MPGLSDGAVPKETLLAEMDKLAVPEECRECPLVIGFVIAALRNDSAVVQIDTNPSLEDQADQGVHDTRLRIGRASADMARNFARVLFERCADGVLRYAIGEAPLPSIPGTSCQSLSGLNSRNNRNLQ